MYWNAPSYLYGAVRTSKHKEIIQTHQCWCSIFFEKWIIFESIPWARKKNTPTSRISFICTKNVGSLGALKKTQLPGFHIRHIDMCGNLYFPSDKHLNFMHHSVHAFQCSRNCVFSIGKNSSNHTGQILEPTQIYFSKHSKFGYFDFLMGQFWWGKYPNMERGRDFRPRSSIAVNRDDNRG